MLYHFATCELDEQLYQLRRAGKSVEIEPRVFDVLAYLLHNRARVVSKDELLEKLWPEQVVSETALTRCIVAARKAVGDDGTKQQVVETQHGRGYRFVATVSQRGVERKLVAVLSADVKGYSRLMGEDEVGTVRTLTTYRQLMTTIIQQHHGRVVDSPGDNLLAEFASVVDAVQAAVAIQQELKDKNADLPASRRMEFRIGINLGDVIVEGERIYGDGVNIAARVESLAEASGICISGLVYDQVKSKLTLQYESLGEQTVKNIAEPVRVYRVGLETTDTQPAPSAERQSSGEKPPQRVPPPYRWLTAGVALLVVTLWHPVVWVSSPYCSPLFAPYVRDTASSAAIT